jgi:nucleotide-binding universal stress UspA family protein
VTDTATRLPIERVVVPLDAASENRIAINTAARLAARTGAPLHGVFVEDEELLQLAGLPFARQITLGAGAEALTPADVELHQKAAAERARRELEAAAGRHRVGCSFEIVRGTAERALAGTGEGDLVVAGGLTRAIGPHFRLECRWWSSLQVASGPFLLVRDAGSGGGSVVVLLRDRNRASARLLEVAAHIAHDEDRMLTVISPPAVAGSEGFEGWIADRLADSPARLQIEVAPAEPAELRQRITEIGCRLLAVDGEDAGGDARLREYVEHFACDILTVR